jgi:ABC-type Fe3+/spermidine/putrescine transport system ATPase subunit
MDGGRIMQLGTPSEIYKNPATAFVSEFIGVSNSIEATVEKIEGQLISVVAKKSSITLRAPASDFARAGDHVEISVRPESITLFQEPREGYNTLTGVISHVVYTGPLTYFHLEAAQGARFIALQPNAVTTNVTEQPRVGDRIMFGWPHEATRVLPAR